MRLHRLLDPNDPIDECIIKANFCVEQAMKDPNYRAWLHELKMEAIHEKGWSVGSNLKAKYNIPQEAYFQLPQQFIDDSNLMDQWIKMFHPYLILSPFWANKKPTGSIK